MQIQRHPLFSHRHTRSRRRQDCITDHISHARVKQLFETTAWRIPALILIQLNSLLSRLALFEAARRERLVLPWRIERAGILFSDFQPTNCFPGTSLKKANGSHYDRVKQSPSHAKAMPCCREIAANRRSTSRHPITQEGGWGAEARIHLLREPCRSTIYFSRLHHL